VLVAWAALASLFTGIPLFYYQYTKRISLRTWKLKIDESFFPTLTIMIPTFNEQRVIAKKLKNISSVDYPQALTQLILVDSASTDGTLDEAREYLKQQPKLAVEFFKEEKRSGKSCALNSALRMAKGQVIVISDADCFWPPDILTKSIPYLADPTIGAIVGREVLINAESTVTTRTEALYRTIMHPIRLGESKLHSTIFFEGGFSAYKRSLLQGFDTESGADDSGTALDIVQRGGRAILVPEAKFFTTFPSNWQGKMGIKARRANQLIRIWAKCARLLIKQKLLLPKRIAIPQIFMYILNPLIFAALVLTSLLLIINYPLLLGVLLAAVVVPKSRSLLIETVQGHLALLIALSNFVLKRKFLTWRKADVSRLEVDEALLEQKIASG
jgi:cellulose synthase/poly-beta-1,6-N-acetylglucosamine synthase-like glycosyltransferase